MIRRISTSILVLTMLVGCAAPKTWVATGGSRADGVVSLAYEFGMFEAPQVSEQQAISEATARCSVWGYTGASAFGGEVRTCTNPDCSFYRVTKDYQCTNDTQ